MYLHKITQQNTLKHLKSIRHVSILRSSSGSYVIPCWSHFKNIHKIPLYWQGVVAACRVVYDRVTGNAPGYGVRRVLRGWLTIMVQRSEPSLHIYFLEANIQSFRVFYKFVCICYLYHISYMNAPFVLHYSFISIQALKAGLGRNQNPVLWPVWLWHTASWANSWG